MLDDRMKNNVLWSSTWSKAAHWTPISNGRVICTLCPRNCKINLEKVGFCGVRKNVGGELQSLNYGKSVPVTCESIETEAVFHYAPGEAILSLGNIGCMMKCDFCQNWSTSQSRLVSDSNVVLVTPEEVVKYALDHNIRMLSWTYNDPVVWQEFVVDTSRLAKSNGLKNLYKSAFYISPAAIDELLEVMDIFSISIKSLDADFYKKVTRARLDPVIEGVLQVYNAIKLGADVHLELSNLCVTGRNDNIPDALKIADWMLENLGPEVPLHYVRFHPDYLYTHVERTSIPFLEKARLAAMAAGLNYVYVGNVSGTKSSNTYCPDCNEVLVERYGLAATSHLKNGCCPNCLLPIPIKMPWSDEKGVMSQQIPTHYQHKLHHFRSVIRSCHVEKKDANPVYYQFETVEGNPVGEVGKMTCHRFMLSSPSEQTEQVRFFFEGDAPQIFEVYDRAHFPTLDADKTASCSADIPPMMENQKIR